MRRASSTSPGKNAVKVAAIVEARQGVDHGHLDRALDILAQAVGVAFAAHQRAHAREEFVAVDRAQQKIIHPEFEAAQHPCAIFRLGDGEDRDLTRRLDGADLAAQPQSVIAAKAEADDEEVIGAGGAFDQGLQSVWFQFDLMGSPSERRRSFRSTSGDRRPRGCARPRRPPRRRRPRAAR